MPVYDAKSIPKEVHGTAKDPEIAKWLETGPVLGGPLPIHVQRREHDAFIDDDKDKPPIGSIAHIDLPGPHGTIIVRVFHPSKPGPASGAAMVYLPGGGFVVGSLDQFDTAMRLLAEGSGAQIWCVDSGFLTDQDREILASVVARRRQVPKHQDLIREGDRLENVILVLEGFACRYKLMPLARRHIMALLVPGDFCGLHVALLRHMDHGISTLSVCEIAEIPRATIEELTDHHPSLTRALWWATLTDEAVLREWLANMGQRDANRQMAHLFCELLLRLQAVGLATDDAFDLPMTQADLSDILGLSNVHVNRTLQELRGGKTL